MTPVARPPAYVPTLTEIVHDDKAPATDMQELMVRRVLQHVSGALDKRLHEACEQLIRAHVQALLPALRDEIERVVRESVHDAFDEEAPASQVPLGSMKPAS